MQMEGQVELEEKMKPDVKSLQRKGGEEYLPLDCYKQARIALEMMKTNQEGKTGYEEVLEEMRRKEKEVEAQVEAMEQEMVTRLPDIHEGAGKWIRVFEEETMGKLLAVGDIKALLAKTVGGAKMEEIL